MFIINCDRDKSYCKIDDAEVVFNKDEPPKKGDNVFFYYNKNKEIGQVIMKFDNEEKIDQVFDKLIKETKQDTLRKRKISTGSDENDKPETVEKKRPRKKNPKYTSGLYENLELFSAKKDYKNKKVDKKDEYKKKAEKVLQADIDSEIREELQRRRDTEEKETNRKRDLTVAKTDLKKQSDNILKDKTLSKNSSDSSSTSHADLSRSKNNAVISDSSATESELNLTSSTNDSQYNDPPDDPLAIEELEGDPSGVEKPVVKPSSVEQPGVKLSVIQETDPGLFEKDCRDDKMVKLVGEIYCKSRDYDLAISASTQASHLVRRLITGVFKPSGYLQATLTGQAPRAHKCENPEQIKPLNITAKNAIIDFALKVAEDNHWKNKKGVAQTREELQQKMTQRLGELKRSFERNKKKKDDSKEPSA